MSKCLLFALSAVMALVLSQAVVKVFSAALHSATAQLQVEECRVNCYGK